MVNMPERTRGCLDAGDARRRPRRGARGRAPHHAPGRADDADRGYREHRSPNSPCSRAHAGAGGAAGRGDAAAFDRLAASRTTLERVLAEIEAGAPRLPRCQPKRPRSWAPSPAGRRCSKSRNRYCRADRRRRLEVSGANRGRSSGACLPQRATRFRRRAARLAMRVLPRFETVAQRTSDDLEQLADGRGSGEDHAAHHREHRAPVAVPRGTRRPRHDGRRAGGQRRGRNALAEVRERLRRATKSSCRARSSAPARSRPRSAPPTDLGDRRRERCRSRSRRCRLPARWRLAGRRPALIAILLAALAFGGALLGWVSQRRHAPRREPRIGAQTPQPGRDPAAARRDVEPCRRRPDRAGDRHGRHHRRDRGLDQLRDRGAAGAGRDDQRDCNAA